MDDNILTLIQNSSEQEVRTILASLCADYDTKKKAEKLYGKLKGVTATREARRLPPATTHICLNCENAYIEAQNGPTACRYHPGEYLNCCNTLSKQHLHLNAWLTRKSTPVYGVQAISTSMRTARPGWTATATRFTTARKCGRKTQGGFRGTAARGRATRVAALPAPTSTAAVREPFSTHRRRVFAAVICWRN